MKPHGINADLTYEIIDGNKVISETIASKLEGYVDFENLKTGKKARLPFRSFVDNFIQTIHGFLSGDGGADTKLQSVSCAATDASDASCGILIGSDTFPAIINDTGIDELNGSTYASLDYYAHTYTPPYNSGYTSKFAISRIISNGLDSTIYPEQVGVYTRPIKSASIGVPSASSTRRLISKDLNALSIAVDESVRITFNFEASMDAATGGILLNFVKVVYNYLFKGNLNHTSSKIVSRTGTYPTYYHASGASNSAVAATLGHLFVGSSGSGYIGIVIEPQLEAEPTIAPDSNSISADHTGFTVSANTINAIEYTSISNGAQFSIIRTFTNTGTTTKNIGRIGLLTRGIKTNVTGSTLHANQILLMLNKPSGLQVAPNQILKVTYNFGIQV